MFFTSSDRFFPITSSWFRSTAAIPRPFCFGCRVCSSFTRSACLPLARRCWGWPFGPPLSLYFSVLSCLGSRGAFVDPRAVTPLWPVLLSRAFLPVACSVSLFFPLPPPSPWPACFLSSFPSRATVCVSSGRYLPASLPSCCVS